MRAVAVAVAVVAVGLVACGGSARLSKAQYERHVQAVGAELRRATGKFAAAGGNLAALAKVSDGARRALLRGADELDGLSPPADAARDNHEIVLGLRAIAASMARIHRAAATGNRRLARDAARAIGSSPAIRSADAAARDLQRKGYRIGGLAG